MDFAADLAVFFSPDEFGETITYDGGSEISAIWDRPTGDLLLGDRRMPVDTNVFHLPITVVARPVDGAIITVTRTGEQFAVAGEPRLNRDGTIWACEVVPA